MQLLQNYQLKQLNTFGIDVRADFFIRLGSESEIDRFITSEICRQNRLLIMGGGSNILFTRDFRGCIVHINNKGIVKIDENPHYVLIEAAAGEKWEDLIDFCIQYNYGGLENLSGIPGNVGSSPIQNIGAYGVEAKDSIFQVHTISIGDGTKKIFSAAECRFGYRDSIFKQELKGKVIITKVVFRLSRQPVFNLSYAGVKEELQRISPDKTDLKTISKAIVNIRSNKIPDIKEAGSAGSFFKNPYVCKSEIDVLISRFPEISYFKLNEDTYKLAAAWMIEQCGWKGYRKGDAGVNEKQPLILVNYGKATGSEIFDLSHQIQQSVKDTFNIELEPEVNII